MKNPILLFSISLFLIGFSFQVHSESELGFKNCCNDSTYYDKLDSICSFPGGKTELSAFIIEKLVEYSNQSNLADSVYVMFCVTETGEIKNPQVVRGENEALIEIALNITNSMPNWRPSVYKGQPVCTSFVIPIFFPINRNKN